MWKKRLIWRNDSLVLNNNVTEVRVQSDRNDNPELLQSSRDFRDNNTIRVSVRNGDFIPDSEGPLVISYHYMPLLLNNNQERIPDADQRKPENNVEYVPAPEQNTPMDLSLVKVEVKEEVVTSRDQDSGYNPSPPLVVDLTTTPDDYQIQSVLQTRISKTFAKEKMF